MYTIATLEDLRRRLHLAADDREEDDSLLRALQQASHYIESATQRRYCPRLATLDVKPAAAAPGMLILPDDLLELHALSDGGGAVDLARIVNFPGESDEPSSILQLKRGSAFRPGLNTVASVSVTGIWGWHDRWSQAWRDSGERLASAGLSAKATVMDVDDSGGIDADGARPRIHVGHLLRIEGEYLRVTAVDRAANQLTLLRAVGGTRALAHARDALIETYAPAPAIRDLTLRYAELMLKSVGPLDGHAPPLLQRMRRLTA